MVHWLLVLPGGLVGRAQNKWCWLWLWLVALLLFRGFDSRFDTTTMTPKLGTPPTYIVTPWRTSQENKRNGIDRER